MNNEITIVETQDNAVVLTETKTYTATKEELEAQLQNIHYNKQSIIQQSKQLKTQFDALTERENSLKEAIATLKPSSPEFVEL